MSLIINHNISAINTQRNLEKSNSMLSKSLQKLSSGYKINVAADDPSGLIISEQLRSQTEGLQRAIRNSQEASNIIGIAEGALIEMNEILRSLRALAVHAANNGVTAPDQVRADQAEVDSAVQTIDRIASTTKYSDQYLLNGSKGIVFQRETVIDDSMDLPLLDIGLTRLDQVFKRENVELSLTFNGQRSADQPDPTLEARRAYFETGDSLPEADIEGDRLTAEQQFILTGTKGSRMFTFGPETTLGSMVQAISNVSDSTGVDAQLTFGGDVRPDAMTRDFATSRATEGLEIYGAEMNNVNAKVTYASLGNDPAQPDIGHRLKVGRNLDGQGNVFAEVTALDTTVGAESATITLYKDRGRTVPVGSVVQSGDGVGATTAAFTAGNDTGLVDEDIHLHVNTNNVAVGDQFMLNVAGLEMNNAADAEDGMDLTGLNFSSLSKDDGASVISGVDLGNNTDQNGFLYFRATGDGNNRTVEIYRDSAMASQDLVARGTADLTGARRSIRVEEVEMRDGTMSGLNATLTFDAALPVNLGEEMGSVQFDTQGVRLFSNEYGADQYVRVQNQKGSLWGSYISPEDTEIQMIEEGVTAQEVGANGTISLNGSPVETQGLSASITTQDYSGEFVFNEGTLGEPRISQVGYETGGIFSRTGALQAVEDPSGLPTFTLSDVSGAAADSIANFSLNFTGGPFDGASRYYVRANADGTAAAPVQIWADEIGGGGTLVATGTWDNTAAIPPVQNVALAAAGGSGITGSLDMTSQPNAGVNDMVAYDDSAPTLTNTYTYATNARHVTTETLSDFIGGMQYQLGETDGDQSRTIYGIPSMSVANMGLINEEGTQYSLADVLGGGDASLAKDPIRAMRIINEAIDDVTALRARLGAFQKNMLQTNINSLNVAVENIIKTESSIRDANMAAESTTFTKNQILVQAGTAMLAQANTVSQNVLQLLG